MSAGWVVGTEPGEVTALLTSQSGVRAALAAHGPVLAALAGLAASIAAVLHAARAFRVNPGEAARTVGAAASIRQLRKSASFRERFASEFADVTAAVGTKRMVIFLDDLDRCTPANCAVILEAVNFLVSSGDCFVVLGLAEEPVEAAVGLAYKSMAAELQPGTSSKSAGRKLRREFAKKYLGKLVQLRVPVPAFDDAAALELAAQSERTNPAETTSSHLRRAAAAVAALLPWGFLVLVGILAFAIGRGLETQPAEPATSGGDGAVVIAEAARDPATPAATASPGPPRPSDPQTTNASSDGPVVETPEISPTVLDLTLVLWGVVFLGATGAYVLTARPQSVRRDPPAFVEALRDWNAAIHAEYGTPREHKRFLNRLRLLHVLQDPPRRIASFAERFRDWVTNRREPAARTGARLPGRDLTEVELVACGALATFRARRHKCGRSFDVEAVRSAYPGIKKSVVDETFTGDAAARWQRFDALLQETRRRK
jgi:hypothetical protein